MWFFFRGMVVGISALLIFCKQKKSLLFVFLGSKRPGKRKPLFLCYSFHLCHPSLNLSMHSSPVSYSDYACSG